MATNPITNEENTSSSHIDDAPPSYESLILEPINEENTDNIAHSSSSVSETTSETNNEEQEDSDDDEEERYGTPVVMTRMESEMQNLVDDMRDLRMAEELERRVLNLPRNAQDEPRQRRRRIFLHGGDIDRILSMLDEIDHISREIRGVRNRAMKMAEKIRDWDEHANN